MVGWVAVWLSRRRFWLRSGVVMHLVRNRVLFCRSIVVHLWRFVLMVVVALDPWRFFGWIFGSKVRRGHGALEQWWFQRWFTVGSMTAVV